ncbi:transcription elongation factor, mitochondrial [Gastrophryne carolinensis]
MLGMWPPDMYTGRRARKKRRPLHCSRWRRCRQDVPLEEELDKAFNLQPCDTIPSFTGRVSRQATARFIKPDAPLQRLQAAESVVSIVFGLRKLAWVHMGRSITVKDWHQHDCFHFMKGKHLPDIYLEDVASVVSQLPQADLYILERPAISNQKSSLFPVALHMRTVEAMLYCLLNVGFPAQREHKVFSMARNTVGKHFEIMLGEARTSGVDVVQRLIDEAIIKPKPRVTFTPELIQRYRHHFKARGQNRNEEMCDALLQAVTFYELALS